MAFSIKVTVIPKIDTFFRKFTNLFIGMDRMRKFLNRRIGKKAADIIINEMKSAGIKAKTGQLFESVQPTNVSQEGFSVTMNKLAKMLHHGRPDGYAIEGKSTNRILYNPETGFLVSTKREPVMHSFKPHPWINKAENAIFNFLRGRYEVEMERVIKRSSE